MEIGGLQFTITGKPGHPDSHARVLGIEWEKHNATKGRDCVDNVYIKYIHVHHLSSAAESDFTDRTHNGSAVSFCSFCCWLSSSPLPRSFFQEAKHDFPSTSFFHIPVIAMQQKEEFSLSILYWLQEGTLSLMSPAKRLRPNRYPRETKPRYLPILPQVWVGEAWLPKKAV